MYKLLQPKENQNVCLLTATQIRQHETHKSKVKTVPSHLHFLQQWPTCSKINYKKTILNIKNVNFTNHYLVQQQIFV